MEPARPSSKIRLLLVDDHRVVADALAALIAAEPDIDVVATASSLVKSKRREARVIVYSRVTDLYAAARVGRAGAHAFLGRDATAEQLLNSVRDAHNGAETVSRPELARHRRRYTRRGAVAGPDGLTPRELDVLRALCLGRTTRQMCTEFGIGQNTVRTHVQNVISKLHVHSRLEAVSLAMRERIV
jgi:DNA-binding NarL/FixJ family response regulator